MFRTILHGSDESKWYNQNRKKKKKKQKTINKLHARIEESEMNEPNQNEGKMKCEENWRFHFFFFSCALCATVGFAFMRIMWWTTKNKEQQLPHTHLSCYSNSWLVRIQPKKEKVRERKKKKKKSARSAHQKWIQAKAISTGSHVCEPIDLKCDAFSYR